MFQRPGQGSIPAARSVFLSFLHRKNDSLSPSHAVTKNRQPFRTVSFLFVQVISALDELCKLFIGQLVVAHFA